MSSEKNEQNREHGNEGVAFGPYYLTRKIGRGGMAEVFLGYRLRDLPDEEPRVIKCILPSLSTDPQFLAMFTNEAQLAAQMDHPGIVKVLDFGEYEGRLYMAMEFVDGLDCWRFARRLYPWGQNHTALAVWIACRVLDALEYAHDMKDVNGHSLNVVHRDLSPSNIYLSKEGHVKLGDFGIAKIDSARYRAVNLIPKGKFGYVAPEQVEGRKIDQRADIFSMGVVLAELLIGKKMFAGSSQLSVMLAITEGRLDTLEQNVDRIDPDLLKILLKALARDPERRFQEVGEFRTALEGFLESGNFTPSATDLGVLVRNAVEQGSNKDSDKPSSPDDGPVTMPEVASVPPTGLPHEDDSEEALEEFPMTGTPVTRTSTPFRENYQYAAKLEDGRKVGPTSYAHIIELIYSDHIGPNTLVAVDGKNYVSASKCPELTRHLPVYTPTMSMDEIETPDRRGRLHLETPAELILSLSIKGETGMLVCKQELRRKEVYMRDGGAVYVSSNDAHELLGEYLVSEGVLEREEQELALTLLPRFNGHLGDTIIALGMLSAVELFQHIGEQIRSRFADLITWGSGQYEFYRGVACRADIMEMQFDLFKDVATGLIRMSEELPVEETLSAMESSVLVDKPQAARVLSKLDLPYEVEASVNHFLSNGNVGEALKSAPEQGDDKNLVQALYIGIESGIFSVHGNNPPWRR